MRNRFILFFLILSSILHAQQTEQFSFVRETAFMENPAVAGTKGFLWGMAGFRKQFTAINSSPYTTYLGFHGQIEDKSIGLGGYLLHDVVGPTGRTGANFSFAYNLKLGKKNPFRFNEETSHLISFGLSASLVQYRLAGNQLRPKDEGDPELFTSRSYKFFPDVSFGIWYKWKQHLYAGISVPQIMGLDVNYQGRDGEGSIRRIQHLYFIAGGRYGFADDKFILDPVLAMRWVNGAPFQADAGIRMHIMKYAWIGMNYRTSNFLTFEGGVNIKDICYLGYAYDFFLDKYRKDIGSTHEVTLSYRFHKRFTDK